VWIAGIVAGVLGLVWWVAGKEKARWAGALSDLRGLTLVLLLLGFGVGFGVGTWISLAPDREVEGQEQLAAHVDDVDGMDAED
jgi:hypothetical protein